MHYVKHTLFFALLLMTGLGLQFSDAQPDAKPAIEPAPVCQVIRHWSATVDSQPATLVQLHCKPGGALRLVLTR